MPRVVRRQKPPAHNDYRRYKPYLRLDFERRCAYCHIPERRNGPSRNYAVDHFRPKSRPEFKHLRAVYTNLYYVCFTCNDYKGSHWPSAEEADRLLDPCEDDFVEHFEIAADGSLLALTPLARHFARQLNLNRESLCEWRAEKAANQCTLRALEAMLGEMRAADLAESATAVERLAAMERMAERFRQDIQDEFGDWWVTQGNEPPEKSAVECL